MKKLPFVLLCSVVMFSSSVVALSFTDAPVVKVEIKKLVKFLPSHNEALDKALQVHNLMTEFPELKVIAEQQKKIQDKSAEMQKHYDNLLKCNEQRFGRFKNAKEVLSKVRSTYKDRTQALQAKMTTNSEESILPRSAAEQAELVKAKRDIEQEIMVDALTNTRKWGGKVSGRQQQTVPEDMKEKMVGTGLEELMIAEDETNNMRVAQTDYNHAFQDMQREFVQKLAQLGLDFPKFNATQSADIRRVQKALMELKKQYIESAKEYIEKLDAQDAAYPRAAARRAAATQNQRRVMSQIQEQYPEAFAEMEKFEQQTPQQRQRDMIAALEKDETGSVYLTETNVLEIDQRMAEAKSTAELVEHFQENVDNIMDNMKTQYFDGSEFDFSVCS